MRAILFILFTLPILAANAKKLKDLVKEFDKNSKQATFGKDFKFYSVLIESKLSDDYDDFVDEFNKAAQKYEDKIKFIFMNTDIEENWQAIEYLGIIAEDIPAVLFIVLDKGLTKYKMPYKEITKANIEQFVDECTEGKAVSFAKSEDVAEDWDAKPVKQLVGKNFEDQVFVKRKHSFVLFYAPWCNACKSTMPEFDKLGLLYNSNKNVMIAKMDSTVNEVPQLPIFDVPTIALFVDGEKKPIYYNDEDRTAAAFSAFIKKNTVKDAKKENDVETESDEVKEESSEVKDKPETKKVKKDADVKKDKKSDRKEKAPAAVDEKNKDKVKKAKEDKKPKKETSNKKTEANKKKETKEAKKEKITKDSKNAQKPKKETSKKQNYQDSGKKKGKIEKKQKTEL